VAEGTLIPESVKVMRFDENGMGIYEYGNYFIEIPPASSVRGGADRFFLEEERLRRRI